MDVGRDDALGRTARADARRAGDALGGADAALTYVRVAAASERAKHVPTRRAVMTRQ